MSGGATEFEDALIKHGILKAPINPKVEEPEIVYKIKDKSSDWEGSDNLDEDDDDFFEKYRNQRLQQLKQMPSGPFGSVLELSRPDFVQEVTEASKSHFVFLHLYQDGHEACQLIKRAYQTLAPRYPNFKFVQIISTRCIENYPDAHLPTILVYKDGNVFSQLLKATPEQLESFIGKISIVLEEEDTSD